MPLEPLSPAALRRRTDPASLGFASTAELEPRSAPVGQPRAVAAVRFGVDIADHGFHVFAIGPNGTGKRHFVEQFLRETAASRPVPPDVIAVHDFDTPREPQVFPIPPGRASAFRDDMERLVDEIAAALPAAFEAEEAQRRLEAIDRAFKARSAERWAELQRQAAGKGVAIVKTPVGMAVAATRDGEVLERDAFEKLPEAERTRLQADMQAIQDQLQALMREMPHWDRERRARIRALNAEVGSAAVGDLIDAVAARYEDLPRVTAYLEAVRRDMVGNAREIVRLRAHHEADPFGGTAPRATGDAAFWRRYQVNVLVDHATSEGAPVVFEDHPTYANLLGRIEHVAQQGTLVTDFTMLRGGALHRANGGYLMLDVLKVVQQPFAWEGLKRALRSEKLRTEAVGEAYGLLSTATLVPEPLPLDVKVVLLGDHRLFSMLTTVDPDVLDLFKVVADFDDAFDRTAEGERRFAGLIAAIGRAQDLRPFTADAVAALIEDAARRADDGAKLSTNTAALADLLREADYWTGVAERREVDADDVARALHEQRFRADRIDARLREEMLRGTLKIDTEGAQVGQVNGLSVYAFAWRRFGRPSRITARARVGRGEVIDIEREVELGGPLHSKGVLILSAFLAARFAAERPLSLSASLVFEQSYGGVEGDSASLAELVALLSAIAEVPVRQDVAVTGSVDQFGWVQPVGGVNEKVEAFFELCAARGLQGRPAVLIPEANVPHLMLREPVVAAVSEGRFEVLPVARVEDAVAHLTGMPFGVAAEDGSFPDESVAGRVAARLARFAEVRAAFGPAAGGGATPG